MPKATLIELVDIFISVCQVDTSNYFMCDLDAFKQLAGLIQHIPLTMAHRYVLCTAPVDLNNQFISTIYLKFARAIADNEPISFDELSSHLQMPFSEPNKIQDLIYLESVFDIFDLYLWLGQRFQLMFPDIDVVKRSQKELDIMISCGVMNIASLVSKDKNDRINLSSKLKRKASRLKDLENLQSIYDSVDEREDLKSGALTKKLIDSGLLTAKMMKELQKEWIRSLKPDDKSKEDK